MKHYTQNELLQIRDIHEGWLKSQSGFVGSGVGMNQEGAVCLKVFSDHMPVETKQAILERLTGVPISIEETGKPRLQETP